MEAIDGTKSASYSPLLLYIDDIEAIYNVLNSECQDVSIIVDQFRFSDPEELVAHLSGRRFTDFSISASKPYLTLELNAWSSRLYVGSTKSTPLGIFQKIDERLKNCRRKPVFIYNVWVTNIVLPTCAVLGFAYSKIYLSVILPIIGVVSAWQVFILYWTLRKKNVIVVVKKYSTKGITESFGAGFWANLISAIIGGLLVALVSHALNLNH